MSKGLHHTLSSTKRKVVAITAALTLPLGGMLAFASPSQAGEDPTTPTSAVTDDTGTTATGDINVGYFTEWDGYRGYHVKNIVDSGSADKITHLNYAFGYVQYGECRMGDEYAAHERFYSAAESVSGEDDSLDPLLVRGNINQLRQLKETNPDLKVLWSFGGFTWSKNIGEAMQNPHRFAQSCYNMVNNPYWDDVFDGIDLGWEFPNACRDNCDESDPDAFADMMRAFRDVFGDQLVTGAITADGSDGGKIDATDYAAGAEYADYLTVKTYDYFGAWSPTGPTAPHSPLDAYDGIPVDGFNGAAAINKLKAQGVPSEKLLLGISFHGRGWTGVSDAAPGGAASGPAPSTREAGIEDYKVLAANCPATGTIAGTAYAHCGSQWWSYDTPQTVTAKMAWAKDQGLGGASFWDLSGDSADGALVTAIHTGLHN